MALTIPNTFVTGNTALASEVNGNFTAVKTEVDLKIANTLLTTKGDIIAASATSTPARQAVGSNGQVLVANSGQTNGVAWVDPQTNRNVIMNGAMQVAQRGTSTASITTTGYYTADRYETAISSLGTWTQSVEADAPTGSGFRKSLKMLCTTADASPSAADYLIIWQKLEGQNLQQFLKGTASAKSFSLSFWVKGTTTGTYITQLFDADNSRSVSKSYTIDVANTWEKKTIDFGSDTTGAFANDNGNSVEVRWWLGSGSTFTSGTLGTTWAAGVDSAAAVGQTNLAGATSRSWQVTGAQLEVGSVATPFEFEDIGTTLAKCQRYYIRYIAGVLASSVNATSTTVFEGIIPLIVAMRTTPATLDSSATRLSDGAATTNTATLLLNASNSSSTSVYLTGTVASGLTAFRPYLFSTNGGYYGFSAEL